MLLIHIQNLQSCLSILKKDKLELKFFFAFFLQALTNGIKMQVIQHLLTLYVPIVTNINFLIAIDIDCQEMRLWEFNKLTT